MVYPPMIYFADDLIVVTSMAKESSFLSTLDESSPSTMKNIADLLCLAIVNEFVGYTGHRLLHTNTTRSTTSSK